MCGASWDLHLGEVVRCVYLHSLNNIITTEMSFESSFPTGNVHTDEGVVVSKVFLQKFACVYSVTQAHTNDTDTTNL